MTVIATIISNDCTVHGTDSLLTSVATDGMQEAVERSAPKLVPVRHWRGAMSYYGFADGPGGPPTLELLRDLAGAADRFASPEAFGEHVALEMEARLRSAGLEGNIDGGLGIHFTAYESVDAAWVPELFHISNWADPSYTSLRSGGVSCTRDTYATLPPAWRVGDADRRQQRHAVEAFLRKGGFFHYNNGDPEVYNALANAFHGSAAVLRRRGSLVTMGPEQWRLLAISPIDAVVMIQDRLVQPGRRVVGGVVHDLTIFPDGSYSSRSNDA